MRRLGLGRKLIRLGGDIERLGGLTGGDVRALNIRLGSLVIIDRVGIDFPVDKVRPEPVGFLDSVLGKRGILIPVADNWDRFVTSRDLVVRPPIAIGL